MIIWKKCVNDVFLVNINMKFGIVTKLYLCDIKVNSMERG